MCSSPMHISNDAIFFCIVQKWKKWKTFHETKQHEKERNRKKKSWQMWQAREVCNVVIIFFAAAVHAKLIMQKCLQLGDRKEKKLIADQRETFVHRASK